MHTSQTSIPQHVNASRRDFFTLVWKSALGIASLFGITGVIRYLSQAPYPSTETRFDLGPIDQLSTSSMTIFPPAQAAIIPIHEGYDALSLVCPHLGCQVEMREDGFECPCHGSRFNLNGDLLKGPAQTPLRKLITEISEDGHLIVDISENQ